MKNEFQRHKRGDRVKRAFTLIAFALLIVAVAGLCLQLFGTDKLKPSEWLKKIENAKQTETLSDAEQSEVDADVKTFTAGKTRSYASNYAASSDYLTCEHLQNYLGGSIISPEELPGTGSFGTFSISRTGSIYRPIFDRDNYGVKLFNGDKIRVYYAEYRATAIYGYMISMRWCIHGIKSDLATMYGYTPYDLKYCDRQAQDPDMTYADSMEWSLGNRFNSYANYVHKSLEYDNADTDTIMYRYDVGQRIDNNSHTTSFAFPSYVVGLEARTLKAPVPLPEDPVKEGHTFVGWYYDESFARSYDGAPIYADTTLYAKFEVNRIRVEFNTNGGSYCGGSTVVAWNTVARLPTTERTGYTFLGWFFPDGTQYTNQVIKEEVTLTARWQINTYTLTLNANEGTLSQTSVTGEYNTVPAIPTPTRTGYTLTGWKKADGAYVVGSPLTQNLTLTAQWQINTYTLTLNGNLGSVSAESVSGEYNTVPTIPTPTRTGHIFRGWKTERGQVYDVTSPLTQNLSLTAEWEIQRFTVRYIVDGEVYTTMTVDWGTPLAQAMEAVEPILFSLYAENDEGVSLASDYSLVEDIKVYAELGSVAQTVKGNWKKIAIGGACGVTLLAFLCCLPSMFGRKKRR